MKYILPIALFLFSTIAFSSVYFGHDLSEWPQSESRKERDNFAGWLLVTSDTNWQEKWETPPDTVPRFNETSVVKIGEELVILIFFVNPKTDTENNANVICSLKVTRPDGSISVEQENIVCAKGKLQGPPHHIRLSPAIMNFVGEKTDPLGIWVVEVEINDAVRNIKLSLKTQFELEAH